MDWPAWIGAVTGVLAILVSVGLAIRAERRAQDLDRAEGARAEAEQERKAAEAKREARLQAALVTAFVVGEGLPPPPMLEQLDPGPAGWKYLCIANNTPHLVRDVCADVRYSDGESQEVTVKSVPPMRSVPGGHRYLRVQTLPANRDVDSIALSYMDIEGNCWVQDHDGVMRRNDSPA